MSQKLVTVAIVLAIVLTGCARAVDHIIADVISAPASDVAARHGADPMLGDPQTLMTRLTPQRRGDAIRAAQLAEVVRYSIARFRDVKAAEEAGYRSFPPEPPPDLRIVHHVHNSLSRDEAKQLDPTQPGALLYERIKDGSLRLVGAMFTAPVAAPLEELDRRVPLFRDAMAPPPERLHSKTGVEQGAVGPHRAGRKTIVRPRESGYDRNRVQ